MSWFVGLFFAVGVPLFLVMLFLLPGDAYGDYDAKVYSRFPIHARNRVHVVVLGDIARSPRMQYHALSIAKHGAAVDLIGYTDTKLPAYITDDKNIKVHAIDRPPKFLQDKDSRFFVLLGPLKALFQLWTLWRVLGNRTRPAKWILVQNPPSIPTLFVASVISFLRKSHLIIDWHNFGYTILALKLGSNHPLTRLSRWYEQWFAGAARVNLTVSEAMERQLKRSFRRAKSTLTVYDRPRRISSGTESRISFLGRLPESKPFAERIAAGQVKVLVSSTSWTADEDFSILLDALVDYSKLATSSHPQLPELLVIITGKGPQQAEYITRIEELDKLDELEMVTIKTAWLEAEDYPVLLRSADLGVSLHKSSSGVDLPMKVVDMFGAGLPVIGWSMYESWPELVDEGFNGRGFGSWEELRTLLVQLFGSDGSQLMALKRGAEREYEHDWDREWDASLGRVLGLAAAPKEI